MIDGCRLLDLVGIEVRVEDDLGCFLKGCLVVYVRDVILHLFFSDAFLLAILVLLVNITCQRLKKHLSFSRFSFSSPRKRRQLFVTTGALQILELEGSDGFW
jgi:hypothetical protein